MPPQDEDGRPVSVPRCGVAAAGGGGAEDEGRLDEEDASEARSESDGLDPSD